MSPVVQIHSTVIILALSASLTSPLPFNSNHLPQFSPYFRSFSAVEPSRRAAHRLFKNFIGDDGRVYACSGTNFFSFERNGSIAWMVHLNFTCNANIAPTNGGSTKIYLVAENRVLKIYPLRIGTSEPAVEVFFGPRQGSTEGPGEIIGISASVFASCLLINVKNRGLFAYRLFGQLLWSAGPVLYRHGYRQGCRKNIIDCYFTSPPVIDHCEASIFIVNTVGELYSLSVRGPYFKWIQDLSSFGNAFAVTPGNNGRVYVTIPDKALILALDVLTGNILWQGSIGPLSSADYEPVVDANGWISYGSLDGFLYSFSPMGALRKFPEMASLSRVIQVNPVLDCSGYAVYVSQTEMEGKIFRTIGEYTHVSSLKPKSVALIVLDPASGYIHWSESDPSKLLSNLSQSDLKHFMLDETTLLAFFAVSRNGNALPCRTMRQKLASSCSQVKQKSISMYTGKLLQVLLLFISISIQAGNERTILLFLLIESILLVLLVAFVRYCCIFWKKKKLRRLDLGKFLEKRRSLRSQKKAFDRMITELKQKASEEAVANQVLDKIGDLVKEREDITRKLSTTYSLGRDREKSRSKSLLPLYDGKARSYSFQGVKKESVTIFHTFSESSSSEECGSLMEEADDDLSDDDVKAKGKAAVEEESSSDDGEEYGATSSSGSQGFANPLFLKRSFDEKEEVKRYDDEEGVGNMVSESRSLRRRPVSFSG